MGAGPNESIGMVVDSAGDVNGDGVPDVIVGSWLWGNERGLARVYSGADGRTLYEFRGVRDGERLGRSVSGAGDMNNDGFADFMIGVPTRVTATPSVGVVLVHSGKDGSLIHTLESRNPSAELMGTAISEFVDDNQDGFVDVLVAAPISDVVRVYDGRTGLGLRQFAVNVGSRNPDSLEVAGDVDGDSFPDVILGVSSMNPNGLARVFSGKTGAILHSFVGDPR